MATDTIAGGTALLVRDELIGFAKSRVMIVLWVLVPALALAGFLLLPTEAFPYGNRHTMTATEFMGLIISSVAGTVAALMVAVDIVGERNRNVFVLFAIRPIKRDAIILAKFVAVFGCVAAACVLSLVLGICVDLLRGVAVTADALSSGLHALASTTAAIALSTAVGVVFGVMVRSLLVAVILVLYVGQNLAIVPMLPMYFGMLPNRFWIFFAISAVLVALLLLAATRLFRRAQL